MNITPFVVLLVLLGIFYFLLIFPQQKRAKAHRQLIASLKKGDRVVTIGGIYGTIRALTEDHLTLEVSKGVEITVARQAVNYRLKEEKTQKSS